MTAAPDAAPDVSPGVNAKAREWVNEELRILRRLWVLDQEREQLQRALDVLQGQIRGGADLLTAQADDAAAAAKEESEHGNAD